MTLYISLSVGLLVVQKYFAVYAITGLAFIISTPAHAHATCMALFPALFGLWLDTEADATKACLKSGCAGDGRVVPTN